MAENEAASSQLRPSPEAAPASPGSLPAEIAQRSGEPAETSQQTAPKSPTPEPPKAPSEAGSPRAAQRPVGNVMRAQRPLEALANESVPLSSPSASSSRLAASSREAASQTENPRPSPAASTGEAAAAAALSSSPTQTQGRRVEQESLSAASAPADAAALAPAEPDLEQQPASASSTEQRTPRRLEAHSGPESGEDTAQPLLGEQTQPHGRFDVTLWLKGAAVLASILVVVLTFRPILAYVVGLLRNPCKEALCPESWKTNGIGGFYCPQSKGCRPAGQGPFPDCDGQCSIGAAAHLTTQAQAPAGTPPSATPQATFKAGKYDLRFVRQGKLLGCLAPVNKVPGASKYGCSEAFSTAKTCDAAKYRVKDTDYVAAVHKGCKTEEGKGTYGYAYDDGIGLKQCSSSTRYEWILCSHGEEPALTWSAENGPAKSRKRFRVTNKCSHRLWIQSSGTDLPHDPDIVSLLAGESYDYSIPLAGLPSVRFLPKVGCDDLGNNCLVQSMPPCPKEGCTPPIDSKFEASFGCILDDRASCSKTGQGQVSTYQDWWDGSAVDGWTLPFSILVNDGGHGLAPGTSSSHGQCGDVVCSDLSAEKLCPRQEFLTPES